MTYSSCPAGSNSSALMLKSFFSTFFWFSIYDLWILLKYAFIFFDVVDRFQLVSLSILNSGKRYILTTLNFTGQSNFFVGCDHFHVFTYWEWSLQSLPCFAWWFSLILTFLSFPWWQLYCLVLRWRYGTPLKGMCRLLPFLYSQQTFGMFLETISTS